MAESVRLVIWDLDETFWSGTLTEGGHKYNQDHHDIVATLAERGIMSSICSKNQLSTIKEIFERNKLWDYFIFPSIDWSTKGPRLATLVEAVQLRAETVLFVDDNPMNLAEAQHFVPGIQTAMPDIIPTMLSSPLFKGKDDRSLTRLRQYKILERKNVDAAASTDNSAFLRASDIRVRLEYDIAGNLDRAVELINRTNQLNFTKRRLSEDPEQARSELTALVGNYAIQAGLVHVADRYGDYGFVGIYVVQTHPTGVRLLHFAFSCRTLGMQIETWLYRHLKRPILKVVGDVLTDVQASDTDIDWITFADATDVGHSADLPPVSRMVLRGGCDLLALSHYLEPYAERSSLETFLARDGRHIRLDHSAILGIALHGATQEQDTFLQSLDYRPEDYCSAMAAPVGGPEVWVLSFWMDGPLPLYTNGCGVSVPYVSRRGQPEAQDTAGPAGLQAVGTISETDFKSTLIALMDRATPETHIFAILSPAVSVEPNTLSWRASSRDEAVNRWTRESLDGNRMCHVIDPLQHVRSPSEMPETKHFDRIVYHRIATQIIGILAEAPALNMAS